MSAISQIKLKITHLAQKELSKLINDETNSSEKTFLRIMAMSNQQGGIQYSMGIDTTQHEDDVTFAINDIDLAIDQNSAPYVEGSTIDFVEDLMRSGFTINNPNFPQSAGGCGSGGCGGGGGGCGGGGGHENSGGGCGCGGH